MIEICWLGQGGFLITSGNVRIVVDPYISDCVFEKENLARLHNFPIPLEKLSPDMLLITHDHMDHLDPEGIPQIHAMYPGCRYGASRRAWGHLAQLGIGENLTTLLAPGNSFEYNGFKVTSVPAVHSDPEACGFLIEAENKRIVITGDTLFDERLFVPEICGADLLLICINGKLGNMNDVEALEYVRRTSPRCAVPMHIGLFAENTTDPGRFIQGCTEMNIKSFSMTPGEFFSMP